MNRNVTLEARFLRNIIHELSEAYDTFSAYERSQIHKYSVN